MSSAPGIDPHGPRFAAGITSVLLLVATFLTLTGISTATATSGTPGAGTAIQMATLAQRALDPGFLLTALLAALFLWGVLSPRTAPWGVVFRLLIRPRLAPPVELEDPRPPRFAQGVGLFVVSIGLLLHLFGVSWALPIATAAAFVAAFLNAVFGVCLGCQLYLFLQRVGVVGREAPAS